VASKSRSKIAVLRLASLCIAIFAVSVATDTFGQVTTASQQYTMLASTSVLFLPVVTYSSGGSFATSVAVADVNEDGKPDVVVTNCVPVGSSTCAGKGVVGVLLGIGDGTFQPVVKYDAGGFGADFVAVADLNGDGRLDLVVTNECGSKRNCPGDGLVTTLPGNGDGTFQRAVGYSSGGIYAYSVAVADVDGDGKPDLVVSNYGSSTMGVLRGNGDGTFQQFTTYGSGGFGPRSVVIADVNGDSKQDIIVANQQGGGNSIRGAIGVLLGNGDGTFQSAVTYSSGGNVSYSLAAADTNSDDRPDLVVANLCAVSDAQCLGTQSAPVGVLLGNSDGTFQPVLTYPSGGIYAASVAITDINGDDMPDVLTANVNSSTVGALLGNGDGTFQPVTTYGAGGHAFSVAVADVNGDGKPDVVTANYNSGSVGVLLNNTPFCTTPPVISLSAAPTALWPPNRQMVPVTVSGKITDTGCTVTTAAYAVTDEYGQVQPRGPLTLGAGGAYSFTVLLRASRLGTDLNGRLYTITVSASNNEGKTGSQAGAVVVPHDQGR
jgi:hypothetical protein